MCIENKAFLFILNTFSHFYQVDGIEFFHELMNLM